MPEIHSPLRNLGAENRSQKQFSILPDFTLTNILVVILALVILVMGVYIFKPNLFKDVLNKQKSAAKAESKQEVKSSGYSAVFLVNNQVYFGKLFDANSAYPRLQEVYYLRVQGPLQPPPATESAQPDVQLVKLGNELHGPADEIKFNKEQILYIEELKKDSRIVKAIEEFKSRK